MIRFQKKNNLFSYVSSSASLPSAAKTLAKASVNGGGGNGDGVAPLSSAGAALSTSFLCLAKNAADSSRVVAFGRSLG